MAASAAREQAARQLWLLYFNRVLLEKGIITEREYGQMKVKIQSSTGAHR